jgi:hypothetical protein
MRALQSLYTLNYFIRGLLHGDMYPLLLWPPSDDVTWAFDPWLLSNEDCEGLDMGLCRCSRLGPLPPMPLLSSY